MRQQSPAHLGGRTLARLEEPQCRLEHEVRVVDLGVLQLPGLERLLPFPNVHLAALIVADPDKFQWQQP
jgi:hypothetical protein